MLAVMTTCCTLLQIKRAAPVADGLPRIWCVYQQKHMMYVTNFVLRVCFVRIACVCMYGSVVGAVVVLA